MRKEPTKTTLEAISYTPTNTGCQTQSLRTDPKMQHLLHGKMGLWVFLCLIQLLPLDELLCSLAFSEEEEKPGSLSRLSRAVITPQHSSHIIITKNH